MQCPLHAIRYLPGTLTGLCLLRSGLAIMLRIRVGTKALPQRLDTDRRREQAAGGPQPGATPFRGAGLEPYTS